MSKKFKDHKKPPRIVWLLTALVSGTIGSVFLYFLTIAPLYGLWKTRASVSVPAVIRKWDRHVSKSSSRSAASAYVDAEYGYSFGGQEFKGTRVSLFKYDSAVFFENLNRTETAVFVDPDDPGYSVIDRRFTIAWMTFILLVPAPLLALSFISLTAFIRDPGFK